MSNSARTLQRNLVLERMRKGPATAFDLEICCGAMDIRINGKTTRYLASKDHGRVIRIEEGNLIRVIKWEGENVFNGRDNHSCTGQPDIGGTAVGSMEDV